MQRRRTLPHCAPSNFGNNLISEWTAPGLRRPSRGKIDISLSLCEKIDYYRRYRPSLLLT